MRVTQRLVCSINKGMNEWVISGASVGVWYLYTEHFGERKYLPFSNRNNLLKAFLFLPYYFQAEQFQNWPAGGKQLLSTERPLFSFVLPLTFMQSQCYNMGVFFLFFSLLFLWVVCSCVCFILATIKRAFHLSLGLPTYHVNETFTSTVILF